MNLNVHYVWKSNVGVVNWDKFDHIHWLKTLTVIPRNGTHCNYIFFIKLIDPQKCLNRIWNSISPQIKLSIFSSFDVKSYRGIRPIKLFLVQCWAFKSSSTFLKFLVSTLESQNCFSNLKANIENAINNR